jgi:hypothetical protein
MGRWKVLAIANLMIGIAGVGWIYAQQKSASRMLTPADHVEIMQLYARQTRGMDIGPADGSVWADVFTADGAFSSPHAERWLAERGGRREIVGRKELAEFAADNLKSSRGEAGFHWNGNILIEPSPEGARASVYLLYVSTRDRSKTPLPAVAGLYDDVLVKTADGWRIKHRVFHQAAPVERRVSSSE